jgi:hypothetical protein
MESKGGVVTFSNLFLRRRDALQAENDRLRREWASPTDEVFALIADHRTGARGQCCIERQRRAEEETRELLSGAGPNGARVREASPGWVH